MNTKNKKKTTQKQTRINGWKSMRTDLHSGANSWYKYQYSGFYFFSCILEPNLNAPNQR
jgi:hypothetical protein